MTIPLRIPHAEAFSDKELEGFCMANPDLNVERDENGQLFINMSPTYAFTSNLNSEIIAELIIWNRKNKLGKVFESNSAFYLPDTSMKGPDAAFITNEKWNSLTLQQQKSIPYLVPDFVIELRSDTDNLNELKSKMEKWIFNGVKLAWLIDPNEKTTSIYTPEGLINTMPFSDTLSGYDTLPNFTVVLNDIFGS